MERKLCNQTIKRFFSIFWKHTGSGQELHEADKQGKFIKRIEN
jgi:hypothetical protein